MPPPGDGGSSKPAAPPLYVGPCPLSPLQERGKVMMDRFCIWVRDLDPWTKPGNIQDDPERPGMPRRESVNSYNSRSELTMSPVPSSSSQCDIRDVSTREDSFARRDESVTLDSLLPSLKNLDRSKEESVLREKLQTKEINFEADLSEDDESFNPSETVVDNQSQAHSSYNAVVLMNGDASTARETPSLSIQFPDHVLEQEEHVPVNHPFTERPNNEPEISSHHLERETTIVLGSPPGRNASVLHGEDDNIGYQGVLGGDMLVQDKPIHTSEIPPEDTVQQNQSHIHEGNSEKLAVGTSNELSPSKDNKQKRVRNEKSKKMTLKRMKRGAEETSNPLGIPPENCDPETLIRMQDTNIEQQTVGTRAPWSPTNGIVQKEGQRRKKRQEMNRRESLTASDLACQSGLRRSTRRRSAPLMDWRGEKLLYGRINKTMVSVIGVKLCSPDKNAKNAFTVISYVGEEYSDMVAQAAK